MPHYNYVCRSKARALAVFQTKPKTREQHSILVEETTDYLINYHKPIPKAIWTGKRTEATIFGKALGLTAQQMNSIFIFHDTQGYEKSLNYSKDKLPKDYENSKIYRLICSLTTPELKK